MELKACPFCGQDAAVLCSNYSRRVRKYFSWAECGVCGGRSKSATSDDDPASDDAWDNDACRKVAIAWNMRAAR